MAERIPFDEDTMTLIMGLGAPDKPGQHGRSLVPAPENKAIDIITQIRDLCEDFLQSAGKEEEREEKETDDTTDEPDMNTDEE